MTLDNTFSLTRILDAPRDLVFRAWTDPEQLRWFLGDGDDSAGTIEVDLRVGGAWRLLMVENADKSYWTGGIYREIVPGERLVFTWGATDGWPLIVRDRPDDSPVVTVDLHELGDKTEMVLTTALPAHLSQDELAGWFALGIRDGWSRTLQRLLVSFPLPSTT